MLAAVDLQRPAAIEQLLTLGLQIGAPVCAGDFGGDPVAAAIGALNQSFPAKHSVLIVDTAGRVERFRRRYGIAESDEAVAFAPTDSAADADAA